MSLTILILILKKEGPSFGEGIIKYSSEEKKEKPKKVYVNPLYKNNPLKYTSKGKIRKRYSNPFNYPRINPKLHNEKVPIKIQEILIGSLLGDCSGELQKKGINPCFSFKQSVKHKNYLFYIYFIFLHWGYAQPFAVPIIRKTKDSRGNIHEYLRFRTITSPNLLKIYNMFYTIENDKKIKRVPLNLGRYLTCRALAFWIMDDGGMSGQGLLLHTNSFTYEEVLFLINILEKKFKLEAIPRKKYNRHIIYIKATSIPELIKLVKPYMHSDFYYKLVQTPNPKGLGVRSRCLAPPCFAGGCGQLGARAI